MASKQDIEKLRAAIFGKSASIIESESEGAPGVPPEPERDVPTVFASEKLRAMLSEQYTREIHSSEIYQGMSVYMADRGLSGFEKYFKNNANEERGHAMKFRDFIVNGLNMNMTMASVPAVTVTYDSPLEVFRAQLAHEKFVTKSISEICAVAYEERNFFVIPFLQGMLTEQLEEEDRSYTDFERVRMAPEGAGLLDMDRELGGD